MLFIFGGLPGSGKSTLAKRLASRLTAVYLRIDTIETAIQASGGHINGPEGYIIGYRLAADNLRLGHHVVADSVNPITLTRAAWREAAGRNGFCEIEIVCSDPAEHRKRVETRQPDIPDQTLPTWQQVQVRQFEPWRSAHIRLDTAGQSVAESEEALWQAIRPFLPAERG